VNMKYICGREAEFVVGDWCVCRKHKEYYTDKKGWKATPLQKEAINDETSER